MIKPTVWSLVWLSPLRDLKKEHRVCKQLSQRPESQPRNAGTPLYTGAIYKASAHFCRLWTAEHHLVVLHPHTGWEDLWHCPGLCVVTIYSITSTPSGFSLTDLSPSNIGKRSSERPGTELICLSPQTNTCTKVRAVVCSNTMLLTLAAPFSVQEHEIKRYLHRQFELCSLCYR